MTLGKENDERTEEALVEILDSFWWGWIQEDRKKGRRFPGSPPKILCFFNAC